jgi:hypothetical protein
MPNKENYRLLNEDETKIATLLKEAPQQLCIDFRPHPFDSFTPPSCLSFNHKRNVFRIVYNAGTSASKYLTITALSWLVLSCDHGFNECEYNTDIETFIFIQAGLSGFVFILNMISSSFRLAHEEASIQSIFEVMLLKQNFNTNNGSPDENTNTNDHFERLLEVVSSLSKHHQKRAKTCLSRLIACHSWSDSVHIGSDIIVNTLNIAISYSALKMIYTIAYNHIAHQHYEATSGWKPLMVIAILVGIVTSFFLARNDFISMSHAANHHWLIENIGEIHNNLKDSQKKNLNSVLRQKNGIFHSFSQYKKEKNRLVEKYCNNDSKKTSSYQTQ